MSTVGIWHITYPRIKAVSLEYQASLDEITRQLPEGYYSTFRTFYGARRVLGLKSHLRRLYGPVPAPEVDEAFLRRQLRALLERYRPNDARVRAVMTQEGQAYLAIAPLTPLPPEIYERGVRVETTELQREDPQLKSTSFIGRSDAERKHLAEEGIFEALLVREDKILEGMTSNFFYVDDHRAERDEVQLKHGPNLYTAEKDILLGVTRQSVIDIALSRGLEVQYRPLRLDQLESIKEAFITSSSRGVVPVVEIDHVTIGQGSPGSVTKELSAAYEEYVIQKAEEI
jgi:branched-chain amino acid aminotransferase